MTADQVTIHLTGGTPWGFRLIGGGEEPLSVAKVSKICFKILITELITAIHIRILEHVNILNNELMFSK